MILELLILPIHLIYLLNSFIKNHYLRRNAGVERQYARLMPSSIRLFSQSRHCRKIAIKAMTKQYVMTRDVNCSLEFISSAKYCQAYDFGSYPVFRIPDTMKNCGPPM